MVQGIQHTVVGIMPEGFDFPNGGQDLWISMARALRADAAWDYQIVARTRAGHSFTEVQSSLRNRTVRMVGVRAALGAGPARISRHAFVESLVVTLAALPAALAAAWAPLAILPTWWEVATPGDVDFT